MKRLLVVDSSSKNSEILQKKLKEAGFVCEISNTTKDIENYFEKNHIDLVSIEWESAGDGFSDFVMRVKNVNKKTSVVAYSPNKDKKLEILSLNSGADDFCESPFFDNSFDESRFAVLLSRIEARLRFGGTNVIDVGELVIDPDEEKIYYLNKEIELKGKPFEVLTHLAKHRDQIVSKEQLLDAIWEEPELVTPNVIEVAINQIRQKMDKPLGIGTIETVRRRGYRFCFPNCSGQTITDQ